MHTSEVKTSDQSMQCNQVSTTAKTDASCQSSNFNEQQRTCSN